MSIRGLSLELQHRHGQAAAPERWWPTAHHTTTPPVFERAVGAVLRQNARWPDAQADLNRLALARLFTVPRLAAAFRPRVAECIRATGDVHAKAGALVGLASLIARAYGSELGFRAEADRAHLLSVKGIGELTADHILLFACGRPVWPVDDAGLRAFARRGLVRFPDTAEERARTAAALRHQVVRELAGDVRALQAFYAGLMLDAAQPGVAGEPAMPPPVAA